MYVSLVCRHIAIKERQNIMKVDRIRQIYEMLKEEQTISINKLCDSFQVSKNTIRRDIAELEKNGLVKKVYGGIVLQQSSDMSPEPFSAREVKNSESKKKVAQIAASMVGNNEVIFIDSGTTTMHMMPLLADRVGLTVITTSVFVINAASSCPNINVIATGGSLYTPSQAFVGPSVLSCLTHYNISKIFLASTGISIESGATNASPMECEVKQRLMKKPAKKFLLIDHTKLDKASLMTYTPLKDLDYVIIDSMPPQKYVDFFAQNSVKLLTEMPKEL